MNMDPGKIPFNALIVGPTNSGKSKFLVDQLYGPFRGKFDYIGSSARRSHTTRPTTGLAKTIREWM